MGGAVGAAACPEAAGGPPGKPAGIGSPGANCGTPCPVNVALGKSWDAQYAVGIAVVIDPDKPTPADGMPDLLFFLTSIDQVTVGGNWDVLGLRGTGSFDYAIHDVFVPVEFTRSNFAQAEMLWGGRSAQVGTVGWLMVDHTAFELGAGRRLLDELAAHARRPNPRGPRPAERERFQQAFARAEVAFRSADAWVLQLWSEIEDGLDRTGGIPRPLMTQARAALRHIHEVNAANAAFAFDEGGGTALRGGPLQRYCRDIAAAGQHILLSPDFLNFCAKDFLGEAEGLQWSVFGLA